MKRKLTMAAAALAIAAGTGSAYAWDITSDPDATMTEQQKLGPNEHTRQLRGGGYVTQRGYQAYRAAPAYGYSYGYAPSYGYGYGYGPSYSYGYAPAAYGYAPGYAYGYGGPGISVGVGW
jgi:hypothetical protein